MSKLTLARAGDEQAFKQLTEPHRRELFVHCYRILGSVQDAEDMVQETLFSAWEHLAGFQERSSLRTWLYRIATNRCLNALRDQRRRTEEPTVEKPEPTRYAEPIWLQPLPDVLLEGVPDDAPGPEARYEVKEAVALAFVSGLQRLAPQQRAVLVLRDVLGVRAAEVAEMLDTGTAAVNSALQRARAQLEAAPERPVGGRLLPRERALLSAFSDAFEAGDVDRVVTMLTDDAWLRMPPEPHEYQGRCAIGDFLNSRWFIRQGEMRLVPTRANGQPAYGYYVPDKTTGVLRAGGLMVLEMDGDRIATITRFGDLSVLPYFGLPRFLRMSAG